MSSKLYTGFSCIFLLPQAREFQCNEDRAAGARAHWQDLCLCPPLVSSLNCTARILCFDPGLHWQGHSKLCALLQDLDWWHVLC